MREVVVSESFVASESGTLRACIATILEAPLEAVPEPVIEPGSAAAVCDCASPAQSSRGVPCGRCCGSLYTAAHSGPTSCQEESCGSGKRSGPSYRSRGTARPGGRRAGRAFWSSAPRWWESRTRPRPRAQPPPCAVAVAASVVGSNNMSRDDRGREMRFASAARLPANLRKARAAPLGLPASAARAVVRPRRNDASPEARRRSEAWWRGHALRFRARGRAGP